MAHVINLDKRPDRYEYIIDQFKNIKSIKLQRFSAITHEKGMVGCGMSHQQILRENKDKNEHVLIFEDDCMLLDPNNFDERWSEIKRWLDNNEDKWDVFLGGTQDISTKIQHVVYDKNLKLIMFNRAPLAHFIYYNRKFIDNVLAVDTTKIAIDGISRVYKQMRIVTCYPFLAHQKPGLSNISGYETNFMENRIWSENNVAKLIRKYKYHL